jgi:translation elongation factor IF5A
MQAEEENNIKYMGVNDLRVGSYIVLDGGACVIISISVSKTGKHGSAKAHLTTKNIFTDKKIEALYSTSEMVKVPIVTKLKYTVLNITEDGEITLLNELLEEVVGLVNLDQSDVCYKLKTMFDDGKNVAVTVISALGISKVFDTCEEKI